MNKRRALCVGNNYPGTSAELSGCVNDAHDWAELLAGAGYEVTVLLEATAGQVLDGLDTLVPLTGFGDRLVFTYSGHGSWVPDTDGDEPDRRDECLVAADYADGGLVTDDQLADTFGRLRTGAGALTVSDSCHSGTMHRFAEPGSLRSEHARRPRFLSPAVFTDLSEQSALRTELTVSTAPPRPLTSLLSGCTDLEYSYDAWFAGRANGAATRTAIDTYVAGSSLASWHRRVRERLPSAAYPQSPQLQATRYRRYTRAV